MHNAYVFCSTILRQKAGIDSANQGRSASMH